MIRNFLLSALLMGLLGGCVTAGYGYRDGTTTTPAASTASRASRYRYHVLRPRLRLLPVSALATVITHIPAIGYGYYPYSGYGYGNYPHGHYPYGDRYRYYYGYPYYRGYPYYGYPYYGNPSSELLLPPAPQAAAAAGHHCPTPGTDPAHEPAGDLAAAQTLSTAATAAASWRNRAAAASARASSRARRRASSCRAGRRLAATARRRAGHGRRLAAAARRGAGRASAPPVRETPRAEPRRNDGSRTEQPNRRAAPQRRSANSGDQHER